MARRSASVLSLLLLLLISSGLHAQSSWVPGEVLVRLKQASDTALLRSQWRERVPQGPAIARIEVLGEGSRYAGLRFTGSAPSSEPELQRLVADLPAVESSSLNYLVQRRAQPNDPQYGSQWHLVDMNVEPVWNSTTGGTTAMGQRIAVGIVDSGVEGAHPDLADNMMFDQPAADEHGTQVAGVVGAVGNNGTGVSGVNWDVDLVSPATVNTLSDAFTQFQFCLNQRTLFNQSGGTQGRLIVAITISWGVPGAACGFGDPLLDDLGAAGILVVTSGPNDGTDIDVTPDYPATCPNANNIVVTSYGEQNEVPFAVGDNTVHLLAPGLDILTTDLGGSYAAVGGNSFAIPNVAGAVALLYSTDCITFAQGITSDPQGTALQVKQAILDGVAPFPGGNAITITGGKLNVNGAYQQLATQCVPCASVTVALNTPAGADVQYSVVNGLGMPQASGTGDTFTLCVTDACFTTTVTDDLGPVDGTFSATLEGAVVASGAITDGAFSFTVGNPVQGCTDPGALNYNSAAVCDDGSCCTDGFVQVSILTEQQGLTGAVNVTVTLGGAVILDGPLPVSDLPGFGVAGAQLTFCQAPGCLSVTVGGSDVPLTSSSVIRIVDGQGLQQFFFLPSEGFIGTVGPEAPELCDGVDNDCDGSVDEDFLWYPDADGDGWGANVPTVVSCSPVAGSVQQTGDCDDANDQINPGMPDGCDSADGIDNNCDGQAEDDVSIWFADADGDGWGDADSFVLACTQPPGTSMEPGDCDDANDAVFPGASEACDGLDNDCDGEVDEDFRWYADADGDGFGDEATLQVSCTPLTGFVQVADDCNDADPDLTVIGAACDDGDPNTVNDLVRADCSCLGFAPGDCPLGEIADCNGNCAPAAWVGDGFCDDGSFEWEGNFIFFNCAEFGNDGGDCGGGGCVTEVCDGLDNDCDGEVDEDFVWYVDADGDGFGDEATAAIFCTPTAGLVQVGGDCDDSDADTYPGAPEGCEGVDRNCDGIVPGANPNDVYSPDWTATATTGQSVNLYDLLAQGKTVVLDLFAAWCPPSQQMLTANFLQDWNAHMGPDGTDQIRMVGVAVDQSAGNLTPFIEEAQWPIIVQDGESFGPLYAALGLYDNAVPTLLMICPDRSVTMLYPQADDLPYTGLFTYDPSAGLTLVNERCGCRSTCVANIGCMDPNACDYDPDATCPGPCAQAQEWFADNDGDGVGGSSLGTACTQPANSAAVGGDCDDEDPTGQQGFTLFILTEDPGDFGTAHYVVQHNGGFLEGDLDLPLETEGVGELPVCIATGCYTISIGQNDVPLFQQAYLVLTETPEEPVVFDLFDGYQGGASAEVCDGIDNDCDGVVDEGCGNCDAADRAWILANQATIEAIIAANLNNCLGSGDQLACFTNALVQGTPLPEACASCVAQRYVCILSSCVAPCVNGFGSPECLDCVNSNCNAAYFACAGFTDNDGDGFVAELDCDDANPNVFPGANEICDTVDNDCDGLIDETPTTYYADLDGDGWGDEDNTVEGGCNPPNGATSQVGDCDDSDPGIYPGAPELCNGIDDDCDGAVDDNAGIAYYVDADGDGYGAISSEQFSCTPIPGLITQGGDCDDTDDTINPGAADPCDAIDQDCSGGPVLTTWFVDNDGDGFGNDAVSTQDCTQPVGFVASGGDCDDTDSGVFPGNGCSTCTLTEQAWIATNQQTLLTAVNDCALQCLGDPNCLPSCLQSSGVPLGAVCLSCIDGYIICAQDNCSFQCLNAPEACFSCQVQAGCLATLASCMGQVDADGDGWWAGSDCDDSNANAFPGAAEVCDGVDNDCDGNTDEGLNVTYYTDADGDGFGVDGTEFTADCIQPPGTATQGGDCDDADDTVFPGAPELCDGIDNDCNGETDDNAGTLYYTDADGDGYGDDATGQFSCTLIPGAVTLGGDCNDANDAINPGAADPCDAIDQDCSGGPVLTTWYQDNDGDGFGNEAVSLSDCVQPVGYVAQQGDCDDSDSDLFPGNGCSTCSVTEQQWLASNQQTLLNALSSCALQCLTGEPECITGCLQDEGVPLGAFCLTCVNDYLTCTFSNCALPCLGSEEACLSCQLQSGCFAAFAGCLGMTDADGDGWWAGSDCNDNDPLVNPSAAELCNGVDDDCDGTVDNNAGDAYYPDADGDGFGDNDGMVLSCTPVPGLITQGGDCSDSDPAVNPLGAELCNGLDDDCDGEVDEFNDSDGDGVEDCFDPCPLQAFIHPGDACDDGNANTINDVIGMDCNCAGQPTVVCSTDLVLEVRTDGNGAQITWELLIQGTNDVVQNGGGWYPDGVLVTDQTCLPDGCFRLRVLDAGGDGIANGGYILRTLAGAQRIIDNRDNFSTGSVSAVIGNGGFCLPLGTDKLIYTSCDKLDWVNDQFIVASENPAVSAQFGVNNANSGYQFWWFDPNGSYGYSKFRSHATSDGFGTGATRACHARINNWSPNQIPANVLMNVKVRSRINGVNGAWGPVCRFKIDPARAACPLTKLMDIPGNANYSCGVTRTWGGSSLSKVVARPVDGATQYQFRWWNGELAAPVVRTTSSYILQLNWTPALPNGTYQVQVRAFKNGQWCATSLPWCDVCNVTITGSPNAMVLDGGSTTSSGDVKLALFPNPNNGEQLTVSLSAIEAGVETVAVDIFDLSGARVNAQVLAVNDGLVYQVVDVAGLADGLYMVNITAGGHRYTERLVIAK